MSFDGGFFCWWRVFLFRRLTAADGTNSQCRLTAADGTTVKAV